MAHPSVAAARTSNVRLWGKRERMPACYELARVINPSRRRMNCVKRNDVGRQADVASARRRPGELSGSGRAQRIAAHREPSAGLAAANRPRVRLARSVQMTICGGALAWSSRRTDPRRMRAPRTGRTDAYTHVHPSMHSHLRRISRNGATGGSADSPPGARSRFRPAFTTESGFSDRRPPHSGHSGCRIQEGRARRWPTSCSTPRRNAGDGSAATNSSLRCSPT